jgi:hypothetical protein
MLVARGIHLSRRWWRILATLACGLAVAGAAASTARAAGFAWASPVSIDNQRPYAYGPGISGVSCAPGTTLCVGVDGSGDVLASTDPAAGFSAWTVTNVDAYSIVGVSCPTATLCVAVDSDSRILTSVNPTGGASAWTFAVLPGGISWWSISCASSTLCVAAGNSEVATSTDPTGGASAWHLAAVDQGGGSLVDISCTSTPSVLCALPVSPDGVMTSTDPAAGASSWSIASTGLGIVALSCPTSAFCAAVYGSGSPSVGIATTSDPAGGPGAWTATTTSADLQPIGISCASPTLCVAYDHSGDILTSTDPTGGAAAWTVDLGADGDGYALSASCPSASLCVASDSNGDVLATTSPAGDGWQLESLEGSGSTLNAVSCAAGPLCVAVDAGGNISTSSDPAAGASAWHLANVDGANSIFDIACQAGPLCVAVDDQGNVLTSTDPAGGASAWHVVNVDGSNQITGVSCPSATLCVAVDDQGNVLSSTDPTGSASNWHVVSVDPGFAFLSVSCASASVCVAVDDAGGAATSTNPTGDTTAWTVSDIDASVALNGVSCAPNTTACVAVDDDGNAVVTTDPMGGPAEWTVSDADAAGGANWLSCSSAFFCVLVDAYGRALFSTNPGGGPTAWTATTADANTAFAGSTAMLGLSCVSQSLCVAVDVDGNVLVGTSSLPPPANAYVLNVNVQGDADAVSGPGIDCPAGCASTYTAGSTVTLTAAPSDGEAFSGWSGGGCTGTGMCTVTMNSNETVTATFVPLRELSVTYVGTGSGTIAAPGLQCYDDSCVGLYPQGTSVALTATPGATSTLAAWSGGGCSGTGSCTVTLGSDQVVTVNFELTPQARSIPASPRPTTGISIVGSGSVLSGGITLVTCPGLCSASLAGSPATLTASPASGWSFAGWSGSCTGVGPCLFAGSSGLSVTATFIHLPRPSVAAAPQQPAEPIIEKVTLKAGRAILHFASPANGTDLECALVRHATGKHAKQLKPAYSSCGTTKTYRHLRKGSYTLWVRSVASDGTDSGPVQRSFKIA